MPNRIQKVYWGYFDFFFEIDCISRRGSIRVMIIIIGTPGEKNREVDISNKMAGEKLFSLLPSKCIYNFFYGNHTKLNWNNGIIIIFFTKYKLTANKMAKTV